MRTIGLLGLVVVALLCAAALAPAVAAALAAIGFSFTFSRVWNRVFQVVLIAGLALAWRRLDLGRPGDLGLVSTAAVRRLGAGFAVGLAGMLVGLFLCWMGGGLVLQLRFPDPAKTVRKALSGLGAAALVGGGEEILFRGVLLRRLMADCGGRLGVVLVTVLYGVVHALRPGRQETVEAGAGFERLAALFLPLGDPAVMPSVLGLAAFGLVLAYVRLRSGSLWYAVGMHAAVVAVFRIGRLFVHLRPRPRWLVGPGWPPLMGGVAGGVAVLTMFVLAWWLLRQHGAGREPQRA